MRADCADPEPRPEADDAALARTLRQRAMRLLAGREHSRRELREKLRKGSSLSGRWRAGLGHRRPGGAAEACELSENSASGDGKPGDRTAAAGPIPEALLDCVLDELEAEQLLSDGRYADALLRSRAARGQGPLRIRQALEEARVDADIIDQAFASSDTDWTALAIETRLRRFGSRVPTDVRARARQVRFLQYRGFESAQIRPAMKDSGQDPSRDEFDQTVSDESRHASCWSHDEEGRDGGDADWPPD